MRKANNSSNRVIKKEGSYSSSSSSSPDSVFMKKNNTTTSLKREIESEYDEIIQQQHVKKKQKTTMKLPRPPSSFTLPEESKTTIIESVKTQGYYNDNEIVINSNAPCVSAITMDQLISNVIVSSAFGMNLFLEPSTVMTYCLYQLSQYSNSTIKQEFWFYELITNLLNKPIGVELISDIGFPAITDNLLRYRYLFSFIGSDLNRVPTVIFETQKNDAFFYALSYFEHPDNKCFHNENNGGLRGEIHLSSFNYNHILDHFFEPSFIIITCFVIAIPYLLHGSVHNIIRPKKPQIHKKESYVQLKNELYHHYIPTIEKMVHSIDFESDKEKPSREQPFKCLNRASPFYESNLLRLKHDMIRLKTIMEGYINEIYDVTKMKQALLQLWTEKATFCSFLKKERLEFVLNKYCH